jgi:adenosylmethionine-8-amino-7-oxononanoate aminotransferase
LVFDEICTAFRTGELLAARHDPDALPDMAVLSKGLGGGYVPAGAVLTSAAFTSELASFGGYQVSQSLDANPIASAAVAALLDEVAERGLIAHAAAVGDRILRGLTEVARRSPIVGDVRGRGLFIGVEFVADKATKERFTERDPAECVRRHGLDHGLLMYTRRQNNGIYGDWIVVAPPLVTTFSEADVLVERLDATIAASARELGRAQSARA